MMYGTRLVGQVHIDDVYGIGDKFKFNLSKKY